MTWLRITMEALIQQKHIYLFSSNSFIQCVLHDTKGHKDRQRTRLQWPDQGRLGADTTRKCSSQMNKIKITTTSTKDYELIGECICHERVHRIGINTLQYMPLPLLRRGLLLGTPKASRYNCFCSSFVGIRLSPSCLPPTHSVLNILLALQRCP